MAVEAGVAGYLVQVAHIVSNLAHHPCPIFKDEPIQQGGQVEVEVGILCPRYCRAVGKTKLAHRVRLPVTVIAPIRVQKANAAVLEAIDSGVTQVADSVISTPGEGVPA